MGPEGAILMRAKYATAVVTGASAGIGRAVAVELARRGVRVGAIARRGALLDALAAEVRAAGGTIATAVADAGERSQVEAAVGALRNALGPIDLMVANAGMAEPSSADPADIPGVERMARVNFLGVVYAFGAVLPDMLARRAGHLVAVSSMAAYKGLPGSAGYSATKAAVNAYCEGLRIELRAKGVAVTAVCPGFVRTDMTARNARPMPFLMDPPAAAVRILNALPRRPKVLDFPRRLRAALWLAKWAPDWLVARQVGERPLGGR